MAKYSTSTEQVFKPKTVQMAPEVDKLSTAEMNTGASNLQKRSIRLIDAFRSAFTVR